MAILCRLQFQIVCASSQAASFSNGGFEAPDIPNLFYSSVATLPGWDALQGIELAGSSLWTSAEGDQSIELNATNAKISQTVSSFAIGQAYVLSFSLAGSPDRDGSYGLAVDVLDGASVVASQGYTFNSTGFTRANLGWRSEALAFTPTTSSLTFVFRRTDGGPTGWGPELDNVSVAAVPEPETYALMLAGLGLVGFAARRRKH